MNTVLKVSAAFRLAQSLATLARGTGEKPPHAPVLTTKGKVAVLLGLSSVRAVLAPVEEMLVEHREKLRAEQKAENPAAMDWTPARLEELREFERQANAATVSVPTYAIPRSGVIMDAVEGSDMFDALSELISCGVLFPMSVEDPDEAPEAETHPAQN